MARFVNPQIFYNDSIGRALAGSTLEFFENNTTVPILAYNDVNLTIPLPFPVVSDGAGRFPAIFLSDTTYRVRLRDSDGVTIYDINDVIGLESFPTISIDDIDGFDITSSLINDTLVYDGVNYVNQIPDTIYDNASRDYRVRATDSGPQVTGNATHTILNCTGNSSGVSNISYVGFYEADGTTIQGIVGYPLISLDTLALQNAVGSVALIHDDTTFTGRKLETKNTGIDVVGDLDTTNDVNVGNDLRVAQGVYLDNTDGFIGNYLGSTLITNLTGPVFIGYNGTSGPSLKLVSAADGMDFIGNCYPNITNTYSCGRSDKLWTEVWATNGAIQTSDKTKKKDIEDITDAVLDAWKDVNYSSYRWKENDEKINFGVIAQDIVEVFLNHGIDALDYAFVRKDEQNGQMIYSINAAQCNFLEAALMRRELKKFEVLLYGR